MRRTDPTGNAVLDQLLEDAGQIVGGEARVEIGSQVFRCGTLAQAPMPTQSGDNQAAHFADSTVGNQNEPTATVRLERPSITVAAMLLLKTHLIFGH